MLFSVVSTLQRWSGAVLSKVQLQHSLGDPVDLKFAISIMAYKKAPSQANFICLNYQNYTTHVEFVLRPQEENPSLKGFALK